MKTIFKAILLTAIIFSSNVFANDFDALFAERLLQRYNETGATEVSKVIDDNQELNDLRIDSIARLREFAVSQNIQDKFSYELSEDNHVINVDGDAKYYFFYIDIIEYGQKLSRYYYEVSVRVDGVLYISRNANYNY